MGKLKLTKEDKAWALKIKERDNFECVICKSSHYLNSHHLLPRERKDTKFDLLNGLTLCVKHHMFSREISAHNNPFAFFVWLQHNRPEVYEYLLLKL
jgi:5-methylcytosine-specific restriction endonuclease McrA